MKTVIALEKAGYDRDLFFIVDNMDKQIELYKENFGADRVIVFDKRKYMDISEKMDNFDNPKAILYARNASYDIAEALGYKYFVMLDDDYTYFVYRTADRSHPIKKIGNIFQNMVDFIATTPTYTIAMSQGGDHIGGYNSDKPMYKRKAMNSFVCSTDKRIWFKGTMNEDVSAYVQYGMTGKLFFTAMNIQLCQALTQSLEGGMSGTYSESGTYVKSFYSKICAPSAITIRTMGRINMRLHHNVNWDAAAVKIIREKYKK